MHCGQRDWPRQRLRRQARQRQGSRLLYDTLSPSQREVICFPFDHELRQRINANWKITDPTIASDFFSNQQRDLADQIFRSVTSPEGYERFRKQMDEDSGGFGNYTMAIFGQPVRAPASGR